MTDATLTQRTLILVKPDGVARGLSGEILRRIEAKGYTLVAAQLRTAATDLLEAHYAEHDGKPFFGPLVAFMNSGPLVAIVAEGQKVPQPLRPEPSAATSGATGDSTSSTTSCMARTHQSRPHARSPCGSRLSEPPRLTCFVARARAPGRRSFLWGATKVGACTSKR